MRPQLLRQTAIVTSVACTIAYLCVRSAGSFNTDSIGATVLSWLLYCAEVHGAVLLMAYFVQIWNTRRPARTTAPTGKSVDVFLPTYNEDAELLRGSLQALLSIEYPHRVYVLDDGDREEIRTLTESMGAEYIARSTNIHAKAGNINNALEQTDGEFVAIFDADHIPSPRFLNETLGYFNDPDVAFVQTPHAFYNFRSFCSWFSSKTGRYWEEGSLFHRTVQVGKTNANANIFCGSAAVFRRAALEDVGLIATETITEDMHTGLRLHAKGWKSIGLPERLVAAQAAHDVSTYQTQRLRWCEGNLSIVRYDNPLTMRGLTLAQRIHYAGALIGWTAGLSRMVMYAIPVLVLTTGVAPLVLTPLVMILCAIHVCMAWAALKVSGDGYFSLVHSELSAMSVFWIQVRGFIRALIGSGGGFVVTSKRGRQGSGLFSRTLPQWIVTGASSFALCWFAIECVCGTREAAAADVVACSLAGLQFIAGAVVLIRSYARGDKRHSYRHHSGVVPVDINASVAGENDTTSRTFRMVCVNCNETGLMLRGTNELPVGCEVRVRIGESHEIECSGLIKWRRACWRGRFKRVAGALWNYGVELRSVDPDTIDRLWRLSIDQVVDRQHRQIENGMKSSKEARSLYLPIAIGGCGDWQVTERGTTTNIDRMTIRFEKVHQSNLCDSVVAWEVETPFGPASGTGTLRARESTNGSRHYELKELKYRGQARSVIDLTRQFCSSRMGTRWLAHDESTSRTRKLSIAGGMLAASAALATSSYCMINPSSVIATLPQFSPNLPQDVEAHFQQLVKSSREGRLNDSSVLLSLRRSLEMRGMHRDSDNITMHLNRLLPEDPGLCIAAADVLYKRGRYADALTLLDTLDNAHDAPQHWRRLRIAAALDDVATVDRLMKRVIANDSLAIADVHELSGICLNKGLARTHGRACVGHLLRQAVANEMTTALAMELLLELNDITGARAVGNSFLARTNAPQIEALMARVDYSEGNYDGCISRLSEFGSDLDQNVTLMWADSLMHAGRLQESLELWPGNPHDAFWHPHVLRCGVAMLESDNKRQDDGVRAACSEVLEVVRRNTTPSAEIANATAAYLELCDPDAVNDYITSLTFSGATPFSLQLMLANDLFRREQYDRCIEVASELALISKPSTDAWRNAVLLIARAHQCNGHLSDAVTHFEQVLAQKSHWTVELALELTGVAIEAEEPQLALSLIEQCVHKAVPTEESQAKLSPAEAMVAEDKAMAQALHYRQRGGGDRLQAQLEGAVAVRNRFASYRIAALAQLGKWDTVRERYEAEGLASLESEPLDLMYAESLLATGSAHAARLHLEHHATATSPTVRTLMARCWIAEGHSASALDVLSSISREHFDDSVIFAMIDSARTCVAQDTIEHDVLSQICMAVADYGARGERVSLESQLAIAEFLVFAGDYRSAIELIVAHNLDGRSTKALACLLESLRRSGQPAKVMSYIAKWQDTRETGVADAAAFDAVITRLRLTAARSAMDLQQYDVAVAQYSLVPQGAMPESTISLEVASALLASGDGDKAVDLLAPLNTAKSRELLAEAYLLSGQPERTVALCQELASTASANVSHLGTLARAYYDLGNIQKCLTAWSRLLAHRSLFPDESITYACHLVWAKHYNEGLIVFESCLDNTSLPDYANAAIVTAAASARVPADKINAYVRALISRSESMPAEYSLATHKAVAHSLMSTKQYSRAVTRVKLMLAQTPESTEYRLLLVDALQRTGKHIEAQSIIESLLSPAVAGDLLSSR